MEEPNLAQLRRELDELLRRATGAGAKREAILERDASLTREIAAAKGRISLRPQVEAILEQLQQAAHERSVGAFERMLTAITDDVLPHEPGKVRAIKLELTTERNMPALELQLDNDGKLESLYDGNGGALTNVVSTGLRFITLARSGLRRLILLDETDCWVRPTNVASYFNVIRQLAEEAGMQAIVVSHHDISNFGNDFHVLHVQPTASPDGYDAIEAVPLREPPSAPESGPDYLAWIELENFSAYARCRIPLSPTVNALVGDNNIGKSILGRAFKAAFFGEADDTMIRHDADHCVTRFGFSDGRVLEYLRLRKGTPKAVYTLHTAESYRGEPGAEPIHRTAAARLPDWVAPELGIGLVDDIDVQIGHQKKPVFMLGQEAPPSKRASLLAIGRESGHLHAMQDLYKDDLRADGATARNGERELSVIKLTLDLSKELPECIEELNRLGVEALAIEEQALGVTAAEEDLRALIAARQAIERTEAITASMLSPPHVPEILPVSDPEKLLEGLAQAERIAALQPEIPVPSPAELLPVAAGEEVLRAITSLSRVEALPPVPTVPEVPALEEAAALDRAIAEIDSARRRLVEIAQVQQAEQPLPPPPELVLSEEAEALAAQIDRAAATKNLVTAPEICAPTLAQSAQAEALLEQYDAATAAIARNQGAVEALQQMHAKIHEAIEKVSDILGNECPTCGGVLDASAVLGQDRPDRKPERRPAARLA